MRQLKALGLGVLAVTILAALLGGPGGLYISSYAMVMTPIVIYKQSTGMHTELGEACFWWFSIPVWVFTWIVGVGFLSYLDALHVAVAPDRVPSLMRFIRKARREGTAEPDIEAVMLRNGWGREQIAEAYRRLDDSLAAGST
jgi:hypothetical protein